MGREKLLIPVVLSLLVMALPTGSVIARRALNADGDPGASQVPQTALVGDRLGAWSDRTIRFEGDWAAEDVALVADILNAYERVLGAERLLGLVGQALAKGSGGSIDVLTFVRDPRPGRPAACWDRNRGRILLRDSFSDETYLTDNHRWTVLWVWGNTAPEEITLQRAVLAHELGHVVLDGLEAEGFSVVADYEATVDAPYWPHHDACAMENVVTEIALWALGADRHHAVEAFRDESMVPALIEVGRYLTAGDL
jgi:hypothetical protein